VGADAQYVTRANGLDQIILRKWSVSDLEEATGMLNVVGRLDHPPPLELGACFGGDYEGPAWPPDLERPVLDGVLITFRARPEDVLRYREALRARIDAANRRYSEVIIPRELALQAAIRAKEEERRRIIAEAQKILDLDPALNDEESLWDEAAADLRGNGFAHRVADRAAR
jgi:hypothetical protein